METNKSMPVKVNYREVWRRVWSRRRLFYKVLPITFVVSAIYIFSQPRYHTTEAMLAPETGNALEGGAFGSIASTFGIDLGEQGADAITPMLYPDLLSDNGFIASLFPIMVETADGEVKANYHDYLKLHQKKTWWAMGIDWLTTTIKNLFVSEEEEVGAYGSSTFNPYSLSKKEDGLLEKIRDKISLSVDKKTGVITLNVEDQDAKICKTVADSLILRLQTFITDYRTNKARNDVEYYSALVDSAHQEYKESVRAYSSFADANTDVVLTSYRTKRDDLENEMQLKFNAYTALNTQLQNAKAKVQERTPAFTLLKGAATPIKPAGPKRLFFVLAMLFVASIVTGCYILRDILIPDA